MQHIVPQKIAIKRKETNHAVKKSICMLVSGYLETNSVQHYAYVYISKEMSFGDIVAIYERN